MSITPPSLALVQRSAAEVEKRCRPHLKPCNDSWNVDERYLKVRTAWMYVYRAVDSEGNTLAFLLSPTRDAEAAKRFFCNVLHVTASSPPQACPIKEPVAQHPTLADLNTAPSAPRVITVDNNAAYPKAIADLKATRVLPVSVQLRQVNDVNTVIEQDHRAYPTAGEASDGLLFR